MKITLHVGPHKTGTTSLQSWMLDNSPRHLEQYGVCYPAIQEHAPGHAVIAWHSLGLHGLKADPGVLKKAVDEATKCGARQLVLSSEEFCMGVTKGTLENLRILNDYGPLDLVLTLSPLSQRFASEVFEDIKHGNCFDLANVDLPRFSLRRPGLWPDLIDILRDGIRPNQTHVILSDKSAPGILIESFAEILGIPDPENIVEHNRGFPHSRTRMLNFINAHLADTTKSKRLELSEKLDRILQAEGASSNVRPIRMPETTTHYLTRMWNLQLGLLQALDRSGQIQLHRRVASETK